MQGADLGTFRMHLPAAHSSRLVWPSPHRPLLQCELLPEPVTGLSRAPYAQRAEDDPVPRTTMLETQSVARKGMAPYTLNLREMIRNASATQTEKRDTQTSASQPFDGTS